MIFRFLPMLSIMATIFLLSHTPGQNLPQAVNGFDKICHGLAYATLAASCLYAIHPQTGNTKSPFGPGVAVILFCLVYGFTDEFHQSFIPGRFPSWQDIIADTFGACLTVLLWTWWRSNRGRRRGLNLSNIG